MNSSAVESSLSTHSNDHNKENVDILSQESISAKEPLDLPPTPPLDLQQAIKHSQPSIANSSEPAVRCISPSFPSSSSASATVLTSPTTPPFPLTHPSLVTHHQSSSTLRQERLPSSMQQQHYPVPIEAPSIVPPPQPSISTRVVPVNNNDHRPPLPPSAGVFPQLPPQPQPQPAPLSHPNSSSHGMRPIAPLPYTAPISLAPVHQSSVQMPMASSAPAPPQGPAVVSSSVVISHEGDIEISDEDLARIDAEIEAVREMIPSALLLSSSLAQWLSNALVSVLYIDPSHDASCGNASFASIFLDRYDTSPQHLQRTTGSAALSYAASNLECLRVFVSTTVSVSSDTEPTTNHPRADSSSSGRQ